MKWIGRAIGTCVAIQYAYWGAMFAGAWLGFCQPPDVSLDWHALGMFGASFAAAGQAWPHLMRI